MVVHLPGAEEEAEHEDYKVGEVVVEDKVHRLSNHLCQTVLESFFHKHITIIKVGSRSLIPKVNLVH